MKALRGLVVVAAGFVALLSAQPMLSNVNVASEEVHYLLFLLPRVKGSSSKGIPQAFHSFRPKLQDDSGQELKIWSAAELKTRLVVDSVRSKGEDHLAKWVAQNSWAIFSQPQSEPQSWQNWFILRVPKKSSYTLVKNSWRFLIHGGEPKQMKNMIVKKWFLDGTPPLFEKGIANEYNSYFGYSGAYVDTAKCGKTDPVDGTKCLADEGAFHQGWVKIGEVEFSKVAQNSASWTDQKGPPEDAILDATIEGCLDCCPGKLVGKSKASCTKVKLKDCNSSYTFVQSEMYAQCGSVNGQCVTVGPFCKHEERSDL